MVFIRNAIVGAVLVVSSVNAFFRMPCSQPVVVERSDPIVNPGAISGHVHTVMGGSGFNFTQNFDAARASTCTSCKAKKDHSNYWTPSLFYQGSDGKFQRVKQIGGATIYYLQRRANDQEVIHPFPPGFQMLAGDPFLRSYDANSLKQQAVSFVCLNYAGQSPQTPGIPNTNCPNGLRSQLFFPSCWDGVNLDSPDHKSHVAYPDRMDNGVCPSTHPVRLISIFYEIIWDTNPWKDQWWKAGSHPFVLSTGDPTGYGFHGDFLNGWDVDALQRAIDKCTQNSGVIEDCANDLELLSDDEMQQCSKPSRVDENIDGVLDTLPGCNPVQQGPGRATPQTCNKPVPNILSADQVSFIKKDIPKWDGVGCAKDNLQNRLLPNKFTDNTMTIEKCLDTCLSKGFKYAGLQWSVECWCGNNFNDASANLYGSCTMPCGGDPTEKCGNGGILSVYKYNPNKVGGTTPSSSSSSVPSTPTTTSTTSSTTVSTSASQSQTISLPTPGTVTISASISVHSPTTTTTSTSSSTSAPTQGPSSPRTSSTSAPSTTASNTPPVTGSAPRGWVYRGCYEDKLNPRTLNGSGMYYKVPMTPQACTDHCAKQGFVIAGTEYSGECFCGNRMTHGGVKKPESECNMPCKGDSSVMCGGPARLTVYSRDMRRLKRDDEVDVLARGDDMDIAQRNTSDTDSTTQRSKRHTLGAARSHHQRRSGLRRNRLSHADGLY
ncbi:WSC-domain-containing protein [Serendipita vermifera]|nr:WSC-domain-containing protein [Serendipita vermifera]